MSPWAVLWVMWLRSMLMQAAELTQKEGTPATSGISCRWLVLLLLKPPTTIIMSGFSLPPTIALTASCLSCSRGTMPWDLLAICNPLQVQKLQATKGGLPEKGQTKESNPLVHFAATKVQPPKKTGRAAMDCQHGSSHVAALALQEAGRQPVRPRASCAMWGNAFMEQAPGWHRRWCP